MVEKAFLDTLEYGNINALRPLLPVFIFITFSLFYNVIQISIDIQYFEAIAPLEGTKKPKFAMRKHPHG